MVPAKHRQIPSATSKPSAALPDQKANSHHCKTQKLLSEYSHIPADQHSHHVHTMRDKAWSIRSYPCTGLGVFLVPYIAKSFAYGTILRTLKDGGTYLDIGCFIGADMRQLVFDGAPSDRMVGVDIVSHWDVGFEMYRDQETFKAKFAEADILNCDGVAELDALKREVDVVNVSAVLHRWDWKGQVEAAEKITAFSKVGTLIVGYQIGNINGNEEAGSATGHRQKRHNPESFAKMWDVVGKRTATKWESKAWLRSWEHIGWDENDSKWLEKDDKVIDFVVTRLQ